MNQYVEFTRDKSFLWKNSAGVRRGDFHSHHEKKELRDRSYRHHWDTSKPFQLTSDRHHGYRRDPYYAGWWNPVMWSSYPKQPAWTAPLPKMLADMRNHAIPNPSCPIPPTPTEHLSHASFPTWIPDIQSSNIPQFNPYVTHQRLPYAKSWQCP